MRATVPCALAAVATLLVGGSAAAVPPDTALVPSVLETVPTGTTGDTADDPAIWVNTTDPRASLVITNEKVVNRLTVFDLAGHVVQRIAGPARNASPNPRSALWPQGPMVSTATSGDLRRFRAATSVRRDIQLQTMRI